VAALDAAPRRGSDAESEQNQNPPMDHHPFRDQLAFSIGFAVTAAATSCAAF
jgi:hypothetical protein